MELIDPSLSKGDLLGFFCLEAEGKKMKVRKAWSLFKTCVMKENDMSKFETFYQANDNIFLVEVVERMVSIGRGIGYLIH